jgi:hypothetical protein
VEPRAPGFFDRRLLLESGLRISVGAVHPVLTNWTEDGEFNGIADPSLVDPSFFAKMLC